MRKVVVLGCGAWATSVTGLLAGNVQQSTTFDNNILMYAYDVLPGSGLHLCDVINKQKVNSAYLPNYEIPSNVHANNDLQEVVKDADIIVVIYPAQFIEWLIDQIIGHIKANAYFVSFCKGIILSKKTKSLSLISDFIRDRTQRPCIVVMSATNATDLIRGEFTEATIGTKREDYGQEVKQLLQCNHYRLKIVFDQVGVELCGGLKDIIAIAVAMSDGLGLSTNGKAALLRIGFWEMYKLMGEMFPDRGVEWLTVEESCGMSELFTCMIRHSQPSYVTSIHSLKSVAIADNTENLDNEYASGAKYAAAIYYILQASNREHCYPLISTVHSVCAGVNEPSELLNALKNHPIHK